MKEWEKELRIYRLTPAPPKLPLQEYIEKYLAEKDDQYFSWYLHYSEKHINEKVKGYVQEYAMQGHFMDLKSAYIYGLLQALQNYDSAKGASFQTFQAHYTKRAVDDYIRTMRTGYTVQSDGEYLLLRKVMALYEQFGFRSDEETIKKISLAVGRKPKLVRKILTGGLRNAGYVDIYAGEECDGIAELAPTSATDPYVVLCRQEAFDAVWQAYESLEYRQRDIVAARLGFCMECGSTRRSVMEGNEKMLRRIPKKAFIDIAAEHMMTPNSAERIYDQAIQKMREGCSSVLF